jgi:biopolymer transport protein ExbB/TolQ
MANLSESISRISISDFINLDPVKQFLDIALKVGITVIIIWLIFKIISAIRAGRINRRIFKTYDNTEEIKRRLDKIEKKLDNLTTKKKSKK